MTTSGTTALATDTTTASATAPASATPAAPSQTPVITSAHVFSVAEKTQNFPQYRWEVDCSCGWQGRSSQREIAVSMGNSHGGTESDDSKKAGEAAKQASASASPAGSTTPIAPSTATDVSPNPTGQSAPSSAATSSEATGKKTKSTGS